METNTTHQTTDKEKTDEAVASHDLLAVIDANFDREDIEARWATCGYTITAAERAKAEYERIACERLSFDDVDQAITESNLSCGMFPERVRWFFKGWILSANTKDHPRPASGASAGSGQKSQPSRECGNG